jgi:hypothetical protein
VQNEGLSAKEKEKKRLCKTCGLPNRRTAHKDNNKETHGNRYHDSCWHGQKILEAAGYHGVQNVITRPMLVALHEFTSIALKHWPELQAQSWVNNPDPDDE